MSRFPALRRRPYQWFIAGQIVSVIGSWMQQAALAWYVQIRTRSVGSEYWLGVTAAVSAAPIVLFSTLGGTLADRLPRRWMIVGTQTTAMLLAFAFGTLVLMDWTPLWAILLFAALGGTILAFDGPARQSFAVEMVGRDDLLSAIGLNSAVFNAGRLVGPMMAGLVMTSIGIAGCFFLNGFSFLAIIVALAMMTLPTPEPITVEEHANANKSGFRSILREPQILGLLATLAILLMSGGSYLTLLPALAQNTLGLSDAGYSALLTANGLGSLVGSLSVASMRSISMRRPILVIGNLLMASGLAAVSLAQTQWFACLCLFVTGVGFIQFLTAANSTVQLSVPDALRGRVLGIWFSAFGIAQPIGGYAAGLIASRIGTPRTFFFQAIGCLVAASVAGSVLYFIRSPTNAGSQTRQPV